MNPTSPRSSISNPSRPQGGQSQTKTDNPTNSGKFGFSVEKNESITFDPFAMREDKKSLIRKQVRDKYLNAPKGAKITVIRQRRVDRLVALLHRIFRLFPDNGKDIDQINAAGRSQRIICDELNRLVWTRETLNRSVDHVIRSKTPGVAPKKVRLALHEYLWQLDAEQAAKLMEPGNHVLADDAQAAAKHLGLDPRYPEIFQSTLPHNPPVADVHALKLHLSLAKTSYAEMRHRRAIHQMLLAAQHASAITGFKYVIPGKIKEIIDKNNNIIQSGWGERRARADKAEVERFENADQFTIYLPSDADHQKIVSWMKKIHAYCQANRLFPGRAGDASQRVDGNPDAYFNVRKELTCADRQLFLDVWQEFKVSLEKLDEYEKRLAVSEHTGRERVELRIRRVDSVQHNPDEEMKEKIATVQREILVDPLYIELSRSLSRPPVRHEIQDPFDYSVRFELQHKVINTRIPLSKALDDCLPDLKRNVMNDAFINKCVLDGMRASEISSPDTAPKTTFECTEHAKNLIRDRFFPDFDKLEENEKKVIEVQINRLLSVLALTVGNELAMEIARSNGGRFAVKQIGDADINMIKDGDNFLCTFTARMSPSKILIEDQDVNIDKDVDVGTVKANLIVDVDGNVTITQVTIPHLISATLSASQLATPVRHRPNLGRNEATQTFDQPSGTTPPRSAERPSF